VVAVVEQVVDLEVLHQVLLQVVVELEDIENLLEQQLVIQLVQKEQVQLQPLRLQYKVIL
tara:strand:- start:803 stop:982 length:180 start_codon:yes stop_codon:yes gene_type:complete